MNQVFTALLLLSLVLLSCTPEPANKALIEVDAALEVRIKNKLEPYSGGSNANMMIQVIPDSSAFRTTAPADEPGLSFTTFTDNTIVIDCLNGIESGVGFSLLVSKDTIILKCKVLSDNPDLLFSLSPGDKPQPELLVPCSTGKVTFANAPRFEKGEIILAKVELESKSFIEHSNDNQRTLKVKLVGYLRSEPLPIVDGQYKTLKRIN